MEGSVPFDFAVFGGSSEDLAGRRSCFKAPGTLDKYRLAWLGWKRWAARFPCVSPFPAQPLHAALYFKDLLKTAKSIAPIAAAQYGIRWAHHVAGVQSPTDHTMVQSTMEGCRRLLAKPVQPKDPVPADVFPNIVRALGGPDADIDNLRLLVLVLVGYAGFMRISELLKVKFQDMSIRVPKRKNDQYRQGHVVSISRTGNPTCPVAMTERLAAKAQFAHVGTLDPMLDFELVRPASLIQELSRS